MKNKNNNNNQELNSFVKKIEELLKTIKNMIKTSQNNQSIEINFQKELIKTYKYMKEQKNLNYQIIENVRNIMKLPIKIELNQNINNIIQKNNILYDNLINEIKYELGIINKIDFDFKNFKIENANNIKTLNNNKGSIYCLNILEDGRLAAGDSYSNLIIYNKTTFNPEILIENNLSTLYNFTQLKNKNIACSFESESTLKIIKIKNKDEYENIQIIKNAHNNSINKIIELKNENIITFSDDFSFKIWKLNNNKYEIIDEFKDTNEISDGLEIKDNEIILYALKSKPQCLVFFNLNKKEKIQVLHNLNLRISRLYRIIKLNNNEVVIAGFKKVYLIDINNYMILDQINSDDKNFYILKLSNNLFLIGDGNGNINQYRIENKKLIKESSKIKSHGDCIYSMTLLNDMIFSGGFNSKEIKIWKN